jgi:2-polyprenyl-6-methoxyphenol hydroxylase-like FAD-dependent oxidoreductase
MPKIIVLGGGMCGLAASIMLARDGHEVTVLERDPAPVPDSLEEAWERWSRDGVIHFRQAHFLQARGRQVLDAELPDVRDALVEAGAVRLNPLMRLPPTIADREPRPGDDRLATITARRSTLEYVVAHAAEREPRVEVRRGVEVGRLETRAVAGTPHVSGVRTETGETLPADLVVDAMGRRSVSQRWLADAGSDPVHVEAEDCGFIYYTRYFRASNGGPPQPLAPLLSPIGSFSLLTLPGDGGTWSVTIYTSTGDRPLKQVRFEDKWTALVAACPRHAHWLDGEPITGILAMSGVIDRFRRIVVDGRPVATGLAFVADAWACTNPSLGRGIALGLAHAACLRDAVREHGDDPRAFALAWDELTERELTPWYRATIAVDRARRAEIEAIRTGAPVPAPDTPAATVRAALPQAMGRDPDVFRAGMEIMACLTLPQDVFARPGLAQRVLELSQNGDGAPQYGPERDELLKLLD